MVELRGYQEDIANRALQKLRNNGLVYLAMEVRTGKTLTSLFIAEMYGAQNVLFVTKKKAINDITEQYDRLSPSFDIEITNYEQLHNITPIYDLVIIDEAHSLGAFPTPSLRVKELKRICVDLPIIFLSGTPTPESYSQIFHQFYVSSFSPYRQYKNFYAWAKDYVTLRKKYVFNKAINDYSEANKDMIMSDIKQLMFTFTQEEAGFDQLVQEQILYVDMQPSTYKLADRLRIDKLVRNKDGDVVLGDTAVKLMSKLHQIFSGSVIVDEPEREARAFDYSKAEYIKERFAGKKIAVFYKFTAELYILKWIFGQVFTDPIEFNNYNGECVFASQIVSGREGINLSTADALVFFNIDFSAVSYWQSRARIQTKDRSKDALIYWIFARNGIEDKIHKAVMNKKDYTLEHFKKDYLVN